MIKYNLNNINKWYLGNGNPIAKMYHGSTVAYDVTGGGEPTPPTPPQSDCYGVTYPSITAYSDTTYSSVYSFTDGKWYMLNNLNQYEEYGVYETGTSLSDFTTYEGKLVAIGTVEYQYSGETWSVVGEYINSSTTYEIDNSDMHKYQGVTLSTTFKIPVADVEAVGYLDFIIRTENSRNLNVSTDIYYLLGVETGTVTSDSEYYYYSLPTTQEVVIDRIDWWYPETIHIIVGTMEATVQYPEKSIPSSALTYSSVADMEAAQCPDVGVGQYCYTDGQVYRFDATEAWVQDSNTFIKQFYDDGRVGVLSCGYNNNVLSVGVLGNKAGSTPSSDPTIEVIIGDCVTTIDDNALYGLRNMSACTIGSGVTSIGSSAFSSCGSLPSITIPDSVTSIGSSAFYQCSGLTSVTIGSGVTTIGDWAFANCSGLTSITIPSGVTSIGQYAFNNTPWWNTYSADTSHRYSNIIYINDIAYKATSSGITSCTFREGTISIGGAAFQSCSRLTSVTIPNSVTSIGTYAFNQCTGLTSITIPSGVTTIGDNAFQYCKKLTSVTIGSSVTSIGSSAFNQCSGLTSITIPSGVTSIGASAFDSCKKLTSITCNAVNPPTLGGDYVFTDTNNCPIYVLAGSVSAYKAASTWSYYAKRIQATT